MFRRDEIVNSENGDYYGFLYQVITSSRRVLVFNEPTRLFIWIKSKQNFYNSLYSHKLSHFNDLKYFSRIMKQMVLVVIVETISLFKNLINL